MFSIYVNWKVFKLWYRCELNCWRNFEILNKKKLSYFKNPHGKFYILHLYISTISRIIIIVRKNIYVCLAIVLFDVSWIRPITSNERSTVTRHFFFVKNKANSQVFYLYSKYFNRLKLNTVCHHLKIVRWSE